MQFLTKQLLVTLGKSFLFWNISMRINVYMDVGQPNMVKDIGYLSFFLLRI